MKKKDKVAIIGAGFVGQGMRKIFKDALVYDVDMVRRLNSLEEINDECGLALICVPTPPAGMKEQKVNASEKSWLAADISFVEEAIKNLERVPLILIKSTVPPGTTEYLRKKYKKKILFSPEYIGESTYYTPPEYLDPLDPVKHGFLIVGGPGNEADEVIEFFKQPLGPACKFYKCLPVEAELIKYMVNCWGAVKVTFANEFWDICRTFGASYNSVREGWCLDSRVEKIHTQVFENKRGFGGKCFPKDLMALISQTEKAGYTPGLLKEVWRTNRRMLKHNQKAKA